jgi:hypothetical protein
MVSWVGGISLLCAPSTGSPRWSQSRKQSRVRPSGQGPRSSFLRQRPIKSDLARATFKDRHQAPPGAPEQAVLAIGLGHTLNR